MSGDVPDSYWQALMKFAHNVGAADAVNQNTVPSAVQQMSQEDREFLQNAMADFVKTSDPVRQMQKHLSTLLEVKRLNEPTEHEEALAENAFENLIDLCADIDCAKDFINIGGLRIVVAYIRSDHAPFKVFVLRLIAEIAQNNPSIQATLIDSGIMVLLLELLNYECDPSVMTQCISAVSALARNDPVSEKALVDAGGFSLILRALGRDSVINERFITKAAFLMVHLAESKEAYKADLRSHGALSLCAGLLLSPLESPCREQLLRLMLCLLDDDAAVAELGDSTGLICALRAVADDKEAVEEERRDAQLLLDRLTAVNGSVQPQTCDR